MRKVARGEARGAGVDLELGAECNLGAARKRREPMRNDKDLRAKLEIELGWDFVAEVI